MGQSIAAEQQEKRDKHHVMKNQKKQRKNARKLFGVRSRRKEEIKTYEILRKRNERERQEQSNARLNKWKLFS